MCRTDDVIALDLPRIRRAALFLWKSALGETDFADCGLDYVSSRVAGLSFDAKQACAYFGVGGVFYWEKMRSAKAMEEIV